MDVRNCWSDFPLLVHIQTVHSKQINLKSIHREVEEVDDGSRNYQVTCLEGSNRYLFAGHSSGDTSIFLRSSLVHLHTIPSQGRKICNILCSEGENFLATGLSHGKLCVYRVSHQILLSNNNNNSEAIKLLYIVNQHSGNEITSLLWSSNERNLFLGDSCGLVSQLSVDLLEQFPRPIPIKSLVEATSRVIQMDYWFPYLAISTVYSVFLCDIESAEFVRVHLRKFRDIKSTGLCFTATQINTSGSESDTSLRLLISEAGTGFIHCASMEGIIVETIRVSTFTSTAIHCAEIFSPILESGRSSTNSDVIGPFNESNGNVSLGNLLVTDTNYLISYSHDHICILELSRLQIIAWISHFHKIQGVKLISNYLFIWHGSTICLVSLTQFRMYGEQLLKAGLVKILERWIDHAISSIECASIKLDEQSQDVTNSEPEQDDGLDIRSIHHTNNTNNLAASIFEGMVGNWESEEDEFGMFAYSHSPEDLIPSTFSNSDYLIRNPFLHFVAVQLIPILKKIHFMSPEQLCEKDRETNQKKFDMLMESVSTFYSTNGIIICDQNSETDKRTTGGNSTLMQTIRKAKRFVFSASKLSEGMKSTPMCIKQCRAMLTDALQIHFATVIKLANPYFSLFQTFAQQQNTLKWFKRFGANEDSILEDAIRSDILIYLSPFFFVNSTCNWTTLFFTWLSSCLFLNGQLSCHYSRLTQSLLYDKKDSNFYSQMKSLVYRDFLASDISRVVKILHNLITLENFVSAEAKCKSKKNGENVVLRRLLSCIPLQHWQKHEVDNKMYQIWDTNKELFRMITEACLADETSSELCNCGVPNVYGPTAYRQQPSSSQSSLDECIFQILMQENGSSINFDVNSPALQFALRRRLIMKLLMNDLLYDERMVAKVILRSGSCELLQNVQFSHHLLSFILEMRTCTPAIVCQDCKLSVRKLSSFQQLRLDCIGIWILNNNPLDDCIEILNNSGLNIVGLFSTKWVT